MRQFKSDWEYMMIIDINDSVFATAIAQKQISIVEFGAAWCAPCKQQLPVLKSIAEEFPEVSVYKIDVDANPITKDKYDISGVPTIIAFMDGVEYTRVVGATPKAKLLKTLNI